MSVEARSPSLNAAGSSADPRAWVARIPDMRDDVTAIHAWPPEPTRSCAQPSFTVTAGDALGRVFVLRPAQYVLGRDEKADIKLPDDSVSRRHAHIVVATTSLVNLVDLGSTNGTCVNRRRVDVVILRDGDDIEVGPRVRLRFALLAEMGLAANHNLVLTPRQLEVARLIARGHSNPEIAARLGLSVRTVASHLDHIYDRCGIGSRAELARVITERDFLRPARGQ